MENGLLGPTVNVDILKLSRCVHRTKDVPNLTVSNYKLSVTLGHFGRRVSVDFLLFYNIVNLVNILQRVNTIRIELSETFNFTTLCKRCGFVTKLTSNEKGQVN